MLLTSSGIDLVMFVTPSENPLEQARKTLESKFPNIRESEFSDTFILKILGIEQVMDLRPYCNDDPFISGNLEKLKGGNLHPLAQSAFNHLAFSTLIMECFIKACKSLMPSLNFETYQSRADFSKITEIYQSQWLREISLLMPAIASIGQDDTPQSAECIDPAVFASLQHIIDAFVVEANKFTNGNFVAFYDYYDKHYKGLFDKELGNLKNYIGLDFGFAIQYINMLNHAKNMGLLSSILNPVLSSQEDFKEYSERLRAHFEKALGLRLSIETACDLCSELHGFEIGLKEIKEVIYVPGAQYLTTTSNALNLKEKNKCDFISPDWISTLLAPDTESDNTASCEDGYPQEIYELILDLSSAWFAYYENGEPSGGFESLTHSSKAATQMIALVAIKKQIKA